MHTLTCFLCMTARRPWITHFFQSLTRHDIRLLYEDRDVQFFNRIMSNPDHCLFQLLPSERDSHGRSLRSSGHNYTLPSVATSLHKSSFINKCLFKYIWFFFLLVWFALSSVYIVMGISCVVSGIGCFFWLKYFWSWFLLLCILYVLMLGISCTRLFLL